MEQTENSNFTTISIGGMNCNHCKMNVEKNISAMQGVEEVNVDLPTGQVIIKGNGLNLDMIAAKVNEIGYQFKGTV